MHSLIVFGSDPTLCQIMWRMTLTFSENFVNSNFIFQTNQLSIHENFHMESPNCKYSCIMTILPNDFKISINVFKMQ